MSKSVYYCRFTGDYARDTSHLNLIQHGAYTVLLDFYYSSGKPLPPDMNALCRICRAFEDAEREAVSQIVSAFFELKADGYHNKRADTEITYRAEQHERLSNGGKKGNEKRWGKDSSLGDTLGDRIPSPSPSPSPHPTPQKAKSKPAATRPADSRYQPFVEFAYAAFEAKHGRKPSWQGKNWKALQSLLASNKDLGLPELQTRWQNYLASTEAFTVKQGGSLAYFCSHADSFITGPIFERKGGPNGKLTGEALERANLISAGFKPGLVQ